MPERMFGRKVRTLSSHVDALQSDGNDSSDERLFEDLLDISYDEYRVALNSAPSYSDSLGDRHHHLDKVEERIAGGEGVTSLYGQDVNVRLHEFLDIAKESLQRYFAGEDVRVLVDCLREHNIVEFRSAFVAYALRLVLDYELHERIRLCYGFSDLKSAGVLTDRSMLGGMEKLFTALSDMILDVPHCTVFMLEMLNGLCCCGALDVCVYMRLPGIFYESLPEKLSLGCNEPLIRLMKDDLDATKERIKVAVHAYFTSGDIKQLDYFFNESTEHLCKLQNKLLEIATEKKIYVTEKQNKDVAHEQCKSEDDAKPLPNHELDLSLMVPCGAGGVIESRLASEIEAWKTSQGRLTDKRNFTWATSYHELVRSLIIVSMDMTDEVRELASHAIDSLFSNKIGPDDCRIGFSRIIGDIDELRLDIPHIEDLIIKFLCRAIVDEVLPPSYLYETYRLRLGGISGMKVCKECQIQLFGEKKEGVRTILSRFRKVWTGPDEVSFEQNIKDIIFGFFDDKKPQPAAKKLINMELVPEQCKVVVKRLAVATAQRARHDGPHTGAQKVLRQQPQSTETNEQLIDAVIELFKHLNTYAEFSQKIIGQGIRDAADSFGLPQQRHSLATIFTLKRKAEDLSLAEDEEPILSQEEL